MPAEKPRSKHDARSEEAGRQGHVDLRLGDGFSRDPRARDRLHPDDDVGRRDQNEEDHPGPTVALSPFAHQFVHHFQGGGT